MRHLFPVVLSVLALALSALFSCNDPTAIGSDLVEGDALDLGFTDTITLRGYNEKQDSVRVYFTSSNPLQYENFLFGDYVDPVFGSAAASIYTQVSLAIQGSTSIPPPFTGQGYEIDSVVLLLPYNADRSYGKLDGADGMQIEVFELKESLDASKFSYSNQTYETFPDPVATVPFTPNVKDSVRVLVPGTADSTILTPPHLRVKLGAAFQEKLKTANPSHFANQDSLSAFLKGFYLKPGKQSGGVVSFKMRNTFTGLRVYYRQTTDGSLGQYLFPILISDVVTSNFVEDFTGAVVEKYLSATGDEKDSLFFVRGMSGVNIVIEVPYIQELKNLIVNKAELEFSILDLANDDPIYLPADYLAVYEIADDSTRALISDFTLAQSTTNFRGVYGGFPNADGKYRINISSHLQKMLEGTATNRMVIGVSLQPEKASRAVLAGTRYTDPSLRPKLRLSFSRY